MVVVDSVRSARSRVVREGDFDDKTKQLMASRAGHECSVPYCTVRTVGPGAAPDEVAKLGQASHIYSAGEKGPRGRGGLNPAQLAGLDNGIWTCELHGKDIDNNKGAAFPAGLLRSWKRMQEARAKRASSGAPTPYWIEGLTFKRSPLFAPNSKILFGKVTVIGGTNGAGKTAICEWLAGFRDTRFLKRWVGRQSRQASNIELDFSSGIDHRIGLHIAIGGTPKFFLDDVSQVTQPAVVDFVYLSERYLDSRADDELLGLMELLKIDADTAEALAESVGSSGHKRFRHLGFEPEPLEEGEEAQSVLHEDGKPHMRMVVETYSPSERFPLANMSGGVHTEVLLAIASELAKFRSRHVPTMLIVEAAGWGFAKEIFSRFADAIDECAKNCQVSIIEPHNRLDRSQMHDREWVQYEIDGAEPLYSSTGRNVMEIQNR